VIGGCLIGVQRTALEARLAKARESRAGRMQRIAQLQAALDEERNQVNALLGREAELVELIADVQGVG
jgi:hypothetical protein